jgi:hypothetical protein
MTTISHEAPDMFKIPSVPIRKPIPKEMRRFPDTIDLEYDPKYKPDPNFDDSAVSCDSPTYFHTNPHIGIRDPKPAWQVRQSQEKLQKDSTNGSLNEAQVKAMGKQFGIDVDFSDVELTDAQIKNLSRDFSVVLTHNAEADYRRRRHSTCREKLIKKQRDARTKRKTARHQNTVSYTQELMSTFDISLPKHGKHSAGITEIDNASVRKSIGEPMSLFL